MSPNLRYARHGELAALLAKIAPGKLEKSFRATGGTEAVDLALQMAMRHTGRSKLLSLEGSYHGNSIATLSIGDSGTAEEIPRVLAGCEKVEPPLDARALGKIETRLKKKDVAAFVMEPIAINLGVLIPEREHMIELQRLCRKHGTLLIMDEVACGFGRTGKIFATEHYGIDPDLMCLAKALTSGFAPIGAVIATAEVAGAMEGAESAYSTYGWHPYSVEAAIATVQYFVGNERRLMQNVAAMSGYFQTRIAEMGLGEDVEVRAKGLAIAVDLGSASQVEAIEARCRKNGLLVASADEALLLLPPLIIDQETAQRGMDILEEAVRGRGASKHRTVRSRWQPPRRAAARRGARRV